MARETVVEYETVQRTEEVVWCDDCGDNCTGKEHYGLVELCRSCALEHNEHALVFGTLNYAKQKLNELNTVTDYKVVDYSMFFFGAALVSLVTFLMTIIIGEKGGTIPSDHMVGVTVIILVITFVSLMVFGWIDKE